MKKFVNAVIYSLILTLISVTVIFLLQAPLVSFVYYGFLSKTNSIKPSNALGNLFPLLFDFSYFLLL